MYKLGTALDANGDKLNLVIDLGAAATFLFYDEDMNALRILDFKTTNANTGLYPITITLTDPGLIDEDKVDNHDSVDDDDRDGQIDYWLDPKTTVYNISVVIG